MSERAKLEAIKQQLTEQFGPVGYQKPPASAQWKPGQSGNPKGRPKGKSFGEMFRRFAQGNYKLEGPHSFDGTGMEFALKAVFERVFVNGDPDAARLLFALGREHLPSEPDQGVESAEVPPLPDAGGTATKN